MGLAKMGAKLSGRGQEVNVVAYKIGSVEVGAASFVMDLGEELPVFKPILKNLRSAREKLTDVQVNREELAELIDRCTHVTAVLIVAVQEDLGTVNVTVLEDCVGAVERMVVNCGRGVKRSRAFFASRNKEAMAELNDRVNGVVSYFDAARVSTVKEQTADELAKVPTGTPRVRSWHVERPHVISAVFEALTCHGTPSLVGLVGQSGSGKTTAASEVVQNTEVREAFSGGMVWMSVNNGARERLSTLVLGLARKVYTDILHGVGDPPSQSDSAISYIKKRMDELEGEGSKCLVVADNVCEKEVITKLLETGMRILLTTRDEQLVADAGGNVVIVDKMSTNEAELVLRRAAELPPYARLPSGAIDLIELCDFVAMDVAFVGRWATVRGRQDNAAWSDATMQVRSEMEKVSLNPEIDVAGDYRAKRRKAILRVGFRDLAIGSDDERVPRLYISLGVLPDGYAFTVADAAILLNGRKPSAAEDEASVSGVVRTLERWNVLRADRGLHWMHDVHSSFARENLLQHEDLREEAEDRWMTHLSSMDLPPGDRGKVEELLRQAVAKQESALGLGDDDLQVGTATLYDLALSACQAWGVCDRKAGRLATAQDWLAECLNLVESKRGKCDLELAPILHELGVCAREAGQQKEGENFLRRCLAIKREQLGPEDVQIITTLHELIMCVRESGRPEEAEQLEETNNSLRRRIESKKINLAFALRRLGVYVRQEERIGEAEKLLRRSLKIQVANQRPGLFGYLATTHHELSVCLEKVGRLEEAESLLKECLSMLEAKLGPDDLHVATTLKNLGACVRQTGRLGEAQGLLRRCLWIREAKLGPDDEQVAATLQELSACARQAGRLDEAEALLSRCVAIREAKLGPDDEQVAATLQELGACARQAGRPNEAEKSLKRCLAILEAKLGREHPKVAILLQELSACVRDAGQPREAEELLKRSLAIREAERGRKLEKVSSTAYEPGMCVAEDGQLEESEDSLRFPQEEAQALLGTQGGENAIEAPAGVVPTRLAEEADKIPDEAPLQEVTLAQSLGPKPFIYLSTSHGVELEVQADSLGDEVHRPVKVAPRLQFVECHTGGLERTRASGDTVEEFLAMTFVDGPEEASFLRGKPAKLRFFLGYVDEFARRDGSERVIEDSEIVTYVLETYRPLTSPNGVENWKTLGPYSVIFRPRLEGREVWTETALEHFCTVTNGVSLGKTVVVPDIPGYQTFRLRNRPYFTRDIGGLLGPLRSKFRGKSITPAVRFGNATQEFATFTYYPRISLSRREESSNRNAEAGAGGATAGFGYGNTSAVEGAARPVAGRPVTKVIEPGGYQDCEMPCDLKVHQQMNVRVGVLEDLKGANAVRSEGTLQLLSEELISGSKMLVLRPKRLKIPSEFDPLPWPCNPWVIMNHGQGPP